MVVLKPDECRVLGVLIEKAQTVPGSYPMTLNGIVVGANQRNNRDPITNFDEDRVLVALDSLREKGLVREAMLSGSRVTKYRHVAREALSVSTEELVLLAELLLRGPQSTGELRSRAPRMVPSGSMSIEQVESLIRAMQSRQGPFVQEISPGPGERAVRFAQLLCPDLHPILASHDNKQATGQSVSGTITSEMEERLVRVENELTQLTSALRALAARLGEPDPLDAR